LYEFGGIFLKKLGMILIILLFISSEELNDPSYELVDLVKLATDHDLAVEEWHVTIKEKFHEKEIDEIMIKLKKEYFVETIEDKNATKYLFNSMNMEDDIHVSYEIIIPQVKGHHSSLVATIKGTNVDEAALMNYKQILKSVRNHNFTKKSNLFTCLIAIDDVMIKSDDFTNEMLNELNLKHVSTQSDVINGVSQQETVYGYTALWNNEFLLNDNPLNIQIVIQRLKNAEQKVIIGTPIIITEY
jgi:hypothetical protein